MGEAQSEFRTVALAELVESETNPRRHCSERGMEELRESVNERGVLVPLLCRRLSGKGKRAGKLEIVAGSRRFRAAQAAGLEEIPVRVMELTDDQVLELQLIENLQREDVHPLDEATGYRALMETGRYDVASLATKVGKSESYVYQRMKLTDLIPELQKAFWADDMTAGHAVLIARLQPADQKRILQTFATRRNDRGWPSVREIGDYIGRQILLRLNTAPWKMDEEIGGVGECTSCSKRTGANPALFPEVKAKDTCADPGCYKAKLNAYISRKTTEHEQQGEKLLRIKVGYGYSPDLPKGTLTDGEYSDVGEKPCAHAQPAIVVFGDGVGKVKQVCTDKTCKRHGRGGGSGYRRSPAELAKEKVRKETERQRQETYRRARAQMVEAVKELGLPELRLIAATQVHCLESEVAKSVCREMGLEPVTGEFALRDFRLTLRKHIGGLEGLELHRAMVNLALVPLCPSVSWIGSDHLDAVAAERGVDLKAIARQVAAEAKAAEKKGAKKAAKAAKGAKKTKRAGKAVKAEGGAK